MEIRQVYPIACSKCGSMYRRGNLCNICGAYEPVQEISQTHFSYFGKSPKGRDWNKKTYPYSHQKKKKNG